MFVLYRDSPVGTNHKFITVGIVFEGVHKSNLGQNIDEWIELTLTIDK